MLKNEAQEKIINTIDGQLIVVACKPFFNIEGRKRT